MSENQPQIKLIRSDIVKPAMTFHQKISTFTLRTKFLKPYKNRMEMTSHSYLLEVDQETELVDQELALLSLMQLVYTTFRNNIQKCILVENITNKVIWNYYGKLDRYPYKINFKRTPEGHNFIESYFYHEWSDREKKFMYAPEVHLMRDHFAALQEKITLNFEWHKAEWRARAANQVKRELQKTQSSISDYHAKQLVDKLTNLKSVK